MRLLIDDSALLDFVGNRPETAEAWNKLNALEITGAAELWVSAAAYDEVCRALAEAVTDEAARGALRSTMGFMSVCSVDGSDVRYALDHTALPYEDALTESCARKIQADFIVTNRGPLAMPRALRRVTANELFDVLQAERGLVFDVIDF